MYVEVRGGVCVCNEQPWWLEMLASGRAVSPPACTGPRTFYNSSAKAESQVGSSTASASDVAGPVGGVATAVWEVAPPPEVPVNQVCNDAFLDFHRSEVVANQTPMVVAVTDLAARLVAYFSLFSGCHQSLLDKPWSCRVQPSTSCNVMHQWHVHSLCLALLPSALILKLWRSCCMCI